MTYSPTIPQPNDLLSQSQGDIQINFSQANSIFQIDHVEFNNATVADRGDHKQITFNTNNVPGGAPVGTHSILYTNDARPNLYYRNSGITIPISQTRAWVSFNCTAGVVTLRQSYNIAAVVRTAVGIYHVTLTTGLLDDQGLINAYSSDNTTGFPIMHDTFVFRPVAPLYNAFDIQTRSSITNLLQDSDDINVLIMSSS